MNNSDWDITGRRFMTREESQAAGKQLKKALDNMIKPSKCEYCDVKEESTGYDQSDKSFDGDYEDAVIVKTNNDVDEDIFLKGYNAEPNKYYLMVEGDGVGITPINYCPVCGRKLNK